MELFNVIIFLALTHADRENDRSGQPFTAFCLWDRSKEKEILRHYISILMDNTTIGTRIILYTDNHVLMDFIHSDSQTMSTEIVKLKEGVAAKNTISFKLLKKGLAKKLQSIEKRAFILFFFVNENTSMYDEKSALEDLKRFKIFVVYYGPDPVPNLWKSFATDEDHLLRLRHHINMKTLSDLMHHDSRLLCDTDMYWTGTTCDSCKFTCTEVKSKHCSSMCPYFDQIALAKDGCNKNCVCNYVILTVSIIMIVLFCAVLCSKRLYNFLRKFTYFGVRSCVCYLFQNRKGLNGKSFNEMKTQLSNDQNGRKRDEDAENPGQPLLQTANKSESQSRSGIQRRKRRRNKTFP